MFNKKGQSAMEYLMTYGWAILVVLIALGALFALGVFNPETANTCSGGGPIVCSDVQARVSDSSVEFVMGATGTSSATGPAAGSLVLSVAGASVTCTLPGAAPDVPTVAGNTLVYTCPVGAGDIGESFGGSATITYRLQGSSLDHTVEVTYSGTVEA
jgi:hypothetical protein